MNGSRPTPSWLMALFKDWFDPCPLDPDWVEDGLLADWGEYTYVNPPYRDISSWVTKAIYESGEGKTIVLFVPADCSTRWFADVIAHPRAHILWCNGRPYKNNRGMMLVILEAPFFRMR